jgi:hypothetical protein
MSMKRAAHQPGANTQWMRQNPAARGLKAENDSMPITHRATGAAAREFHA